MSEALSMPLDDTLATHVLDVLLRDDDAYDPTADRSKAKVLEVAQVFGDSIVDIKHFAAGRAVSLGATVTRTLRGTRLAEDFFVPTVDLSGPSHALFEVADQGWACLLPVNAEAVLDGPAGRRVINGRAQRFVVGPDDRLLIQVGESIFVARPVFPSKRVFVTRADTIDYPLLGITGFMGFVAMMMGVALSVMPAPPTSSAQVEQDRSVDMLLRLPPKDPVPQMAQSAASGEKAKGKEGERGDPKSKEKQSRTLTKHEQDADVASVAGILGALQDDDTLSTTLGDSALPAALQAGVGGLIGPRATQSGNGGLGQRADGFGGGGRADSMGGFGPDGKGRGSCASAGRCAPTELRPGGVKQPGDIAVPDDGGIVVGALDKRLIDEVIKRNLSQIRYCYQRELVKNPSLGGKVSVKFVIANDGSVSSATTKSSSLANPAAESCINGRFLRMQFPEPKGGGIVIVSYPFLFSPG